MAAGRKANASDAAAADNSVKVLIFTATQLLLGHISTTATRKLRTVYLFSRLDNVWTETAKITNAECDSHDYFGRNLSISEEQVLIGMEHDDDVGVDNGAVFVFKAANRAICTSDGACVCVDGAAGALCDGRPDCGDSTQQVAEQCDEGNANTDQCGMAKINASCDFECREVAGITSFCGDGVVDANNEECDDGNNDGNTDGCTNACIDNGPAVNRIRLSRFRLCASCGRFLHNGGRRYTMECPLPDCGECTRFRDYANGVTVAQYRVCVELEPGIARPQGWQEEAGANEQNPVNYVNWHQAKSFAFCRRTPTHRVGMGIMPPEWGQDVGIMGR